MLFPKRVKNVVVWRGSLQTPIITVYHISLHPAVGVEVAIASKQFQFPIPRLHQLILKQPNLSNHAGDLALKISLGFLPSHV